MANKAFFFEDKRTGQVRRTPIYASTAAAAKQKLTRPSPRFAKVAKVREVTTAENRAAKGGRWVSSRVAKDFSGSRGFGPKPG